MKNILRMPGLTAILLVLAVAGSVPAIEKVGTTSLQVLRIPLGVRGIAMGNAQIASTYDAEAVWWNPGALTEVANRQAGVSQINMPADVQLNSGVVAFKAGSYSAVAIHVINLFTDDMPVRTWDRPEGTGENFNASDFVGGITYARKLTDKFSLGANARYIYSSLYDANYSGASVDLGTLYKTDLRSMRLAMSIQNLGPEVKYSGTYLDWRNSVNNPDRQPLEQDFEGFNLPTVFRLGVAFNLFEMLRWNVGDEHTTDLSIEMNHPNDNRERLNLGGEYGYRNTLFLRAGGKFAYDEESFAAGFGLRTPVFGQYHFRLDYAYSHWGRISEAVDEFMGQPHRFAVGFEW